MPQHCTNRSVNVTTVGAVYCSAKVQAGLRVASPRRRHNCCTGWLNGPQRQEQLLSQHYTYRTINAITVGPMYCSAEGRQACTLPAHADVIVAAQSGSKLQRQKQLKP